MLLLCACTNTSGEQTNPGTESEETILPFNFTPEDYVDDLSLFAFAFELGELKQITPTAYTISITDVDDEMYIVTILSDETNKVTKVRCSTKKTEHYSSITNSLICCVDTSHDFTEIIDELGLQDIPSELVDSKEVVKHGISILFTPDFISITRDKDTADSYNRQSNELDTDKTETTTDNKSNVSDSKPDGDDTSSENKPSTQTPATQTPSTPKPTQTPTEKPSTNTKPTMTQGQRNALSKANSYLSAMAFSYSGLIEQLEYEGFSTADATYAADNCGANWTSQALKKAKSYLDSMAFSHSGLIEQLEYEGFTKSEATSAANNCGADWNKQAAKKAQSYIDIMSFSRQGLIDQLLYEGFTQVQAEYGVTSVGY